jgi:hypothetical protein
MIDVLGSNIAYRNRAAQIQTGAQYFS